MVRPIVYWPDPILDKPTDPVTEFGDALTTLLEDMLESMHAEEGVGIAANQVGVKRRLAWVCPEDGPPFEIINPEILEKSEPIELEEGCLSVPDEREKVRRFRKVKVRYQDRTGASHELVAEGRVAHVLQHEIDHLYGTVFVRHLSVLKRGLIRKRMLKLKAYRAEHDEDCVDPSHDHGSKAHNHTHER
ncbi:MAG: Peptide deformylase [Acidimicrobiaceae bacterium]|nr:Peptide deformylase [Acidimicrobiaceae bacterium]